MKKTICFLLAAVLIISGIPAMTQYAHAAVHPITKIAKATDEESEPDQKGQDGLSAGEESGDPDAGKSGDRVEDNGSDPDGTEPQTSSDSEEQEDGQDGTAEVRTENRDAAPISMENIGCVTVTLEEGLVMHSGVDFDVCLTKGADYNAEDTIALASQSEMSEGAAVGSVSFERLESGTYTLTVKGDGYLPYEQTIEVGQLAYEVKVSAGRTRIVTDADGQAVKGQIGLLQIGDVDRDGRITADGETSDKEKLVDAIDQFYAEEEQPQVKSTYDLNRDGKLDVTDLAYFAVGSRTKPAESTIQTFIPSVLVEPKVSAETELAGGTLKDLINNESGAAAVSLKPAGETEISEEHPVEVEFDLPQTGVEMEGIVIATGRENPVDQGTITVDYVENGRSGEVTVPLVGAKSGIHMLLESDVTAEVDPNGNLVVNLGKQVAVKKVRLSITAMQTSNDLAEISKVEFVNDMESRIPDPVLDIPQNLKAKPANKEFSLTWDACSNVTGYEVCVKTEKDGKTASEVTHVYENSLTVASFAGKKLNNYQEYEVSVQSVNGGWRSGYCKTVKVTPKPTALPDPPDNLKAEGRYRSVYASWKNMSDAESYNLYYKKSSGGSYTRIRLDKGVTSYQIMNLADATEYTIYVTGVNDYGEGKPSLTASAATTDINPAKMPEYNLINTSSKTGEVSEHIIAAKRVDSDKRGMIDSRLDASYGDTAWGTVDHDPASAYYKNDWDDGGVYGFDNSGLTYTFDREYEMDTITLQELTPQNASYGYAQVYVWGDDGERQYFSSSDIILQQKRDDEGRIYYRLRFADPVKVKKIQIGLGRSSGKASVSVSEVNFYHYDPLLDTIMDLYEDDLHTVLKKSVKQSDIDDLRDEVNTADPATGEYNQDRDVMLKELETAEKILKDQSLRKSVEIYNTINTKDANRGFGGFNAWQPLGVSAAAGEELTIYVGHNTRMTGENSGLQLVATQYHAEASAMSKVVTTLKVGPNQVTIPRIWSTDEESGGALYVQYTGSSSHDHYAVRVSGGVQVPKLDLYQVTDADERLERTKTYIEELEEYVPQMESLHKEVHEGSSIKDLKKHAYAEKNCILGASDIMLDTMMISAPAQQILAGAGENAGTEARAKTLLKSMDAMEEMMYLFYQHKGLNADAKEAVDQIPNRHLNIRYQRMFSGAFMYASGDHIGIEYPETKGMAGCAGVKTRADGSYQSGSYFGWGIAHEIGHCINQGTYAVAEVTNNYFSVLAQATEKNDGVRFVYDNVYKKVTSNSKGSASNVFTQLGMYWQLHLAYDDGYNFKTYDSHEDQLANLFFARVDTYARTSSKAPKGTEDGSEGVELKLCGNTDQDLMRLSCAAAEKNILDFFRSWGKTPDADTIAYAAQFPAETRAICYVNDEARAYRLTGSSSLKKDGSTEAVGADTEAVVDNNRANRVNFTLTNTLSDKNDLLGYEITRATISGGRMEKQVVGFTTEDTYSDTIAVMNNRAVYYEVAVVDKYLNRSAPMELEPVKIEHDGSLDKTYWSVKTGGLQATSEIKAEKANEDDPCEPKPAAPETAAIDGEEDTTYTAMIEGGEKAAEIVLDFGSPQVVTGLKYTAKSGDAISGYTVCVRQSDGRWIEVADGKFDASQAKKGQTVFFENGEGKYVSTYETTAVRLEIAGKAKTEIAVSELDVLGVTGDNVEFRNTHDGTPAIGYLKKDFQYDESNADNRIPKGSLIFMGSYKGNAAYNLVLLYDGEGNIVGSVDKKGNINADQIILADVPEGGLIQDVRNGTWIYWIEPEEGKARAELSADVAKVRAELYRVNDAATNEGQRLVSDSLFVEMPENIPEITLTTDAAEEISYSHVLGYEIKE